MALIEDAAMLVDSTSTPGAGAGAGASASSVSATGKLVRTQQLTYFPVSSLSHVVEERFQELFRKRSTWYLEDISPYIMYVLQYLY